MARYAALLRGVNVGGRNRLPMTEWRALLADQGMTGIATYIQSGNAVFDSDESPAALRERITGGIRERFGLALGCCLLSAARLDRALAANPFPQAVAAPKTLHLVFTEGAARLDEDAAAVAAGPEEAMRMGEGVAYLHTPNGVGRSALAGRLDRLLRAEVLTARNLSTCLRLQAMLRA